MKLMPIMTLMHVLHRMIRMTLMLIMEANEQSESKVGPKARTLDSLHAFDADPGPNRMDRLNLKSPPRPGLEMH